MKKKLIASVFSLIMAFVLMTSASFAWFTVSTTANVEEITVTMTATENLEIAEGTDLDGTTAPDEVGPGQTGTETYWGSIVSGGEATLNYPATVGENGKIQSINGFGDDGRTKALTDASLGDLEEDGFGYYTVEALAAADLGDGKVAAAYPVWVRSNHYTSAKADVTCEDADEIWQVAILGGDGTQYAEDTVTGINGEDGAFALIVVYAEGGGENGVVAADVETGLESPAISVSFVGA